MTSCISTLRKLTLSAPHDIHSLARKHAITAFSCALRFIVDHIALDVSEIEMASCFHATHLAVSQECGRALPLLFLTNILATTAVDSNAAYLDELTDADMQFIHEYDRKSESLLSTQI